MNQTILNPYLVFDFDEGGNGPTTLIFTDPIKCYEVYTYDQVIPVLRAIEQDVEAGYYAAGFLTYEAAPAFDTAFKVKESHTLPLLWFGIFDQPSESKAPCLAYESQNTNQFSFDKWNSTVEKEEYDRHIAYIRQAIEGGETYQVNYTMRLRSKLDGDDLALYRFLLHAQRAKYSAYLNIGQYRILSASPELFFQVKEKQIITKPMKGTVRRGRWYEEDQHLKQWLYTSEKNRAENVMIVDLLRNDVGRIAEVGSVAVRSLFDIETYPTVHQMTSTITANLRKEVTLSDIFAALFPCGSITGAPKVQTMRIIHDLESSPREIYCGTIGFVSPGGNAIFNVAIRTLWMDCKHGSVEYGVGGGITWDSTAVDEYEEAYTKAALLTSEVPDFELLETMKLDNGCFSLLDLHLERLQNSAEYFQIPFNRSAIQTCLEQHAQTYKGQTRRVRLLIDKQGNSKVESTELVEIPTTSAQKIEIAGAPISKSNRFLYHKTTYREFYERFRSQNQDVFDVLLWNEDGEITEFINGNVVLEIAGRKLTPPIECGLLPGTFRALLLQNCEIEEKTLTVDDVKRAERIWFINSVRGWVPVCL